MYSTRISKSGCKGTGYLSNQRTISEYSVTVDGEIRSDRSNARYIIDENIRNHVYFDLKIGYPEKYIDKTLDYEGKGCQLMLVRWAIAQREETGASLKEVFGGAEFATGRGTMRLIAETLKKANVGKYMSYEEKQTIVDKTAWSLVAQKIGGVILISEYNKNYGERHVGRYSGYKFERYMTTDKPNGRPDDVKSILDNRPTFEMMVRSQLEVRGQPPLQLCCGGEIDAVRGEVCRSPIEMKSVVEGRERAFFPSISTAIQCELVGVRTIVTGLKDPENPEEYIVKKAVLFEEISADDAKVKFGKENQDGDFIIDILMDKFNVREK